MSTFNPTDVVSKTRFEHKSEIRTNTETLQRRGGGHKLVREWSINYYLCQQFSLKGRGLGFFEIDTFILIYTH